MESVSEFVVGELAFIPDNGRFGLKVGDEWERYGFHCGEPLEVLIEDAWVPALMVVCGVNKWTLYGASYSGELEGLTARIARR